MLRLCLKGSKITLLTLNCAAKTKVFTFYGQNVVPFSSDYKEREDAMDSIFF
jgi:muramoyltetrapeptide carboxypeptidase LdcA involved in peptidoglycan recycling